MMTGAFAGRNIGETFPVAPAFAKIIDESGKAFVAYAHEEALYDADNPAQFESLLSIYQSLRDLNNGIHNRAQCRRDVHGNPGLQMAPRFGNQWLSFYFDGTKCFLQQVERVTDDDMHTLPSVTLTSSDEPFLTHLFICIPDNKRQLILGNRNDNLVLSCIKKSFGRHLMRRLNLFHQWRLRLET